MEWGGAGRKRALGLKPHLPSATSFSREWLESLLRTRVEEKRSVCRAICLPFLLKDLNNGIIRPIDTGRRDCPRNEMPLGKKDQADKSRGKRCRPGRPSLNWSSGPWCVSDLVHWVVRGTDEKAQRFGGWVGSGRWGRTTRLSGFPIPLNLPVYYNATFPT